MMQLFKSSSHTVLVVLDLLFLINGTNGLALSVHGVHYNQIAADVFAKGLNVDNIMDAIKYLNNEGHIYSTIDENHFRFDTD